jgi:hypothetical protein
MVFVNNENYVGNSIYDAHKKLVSLSKSSKRQSSKANKLAPLTELYGSLANSKKQLPEINSFTS